MQMFFNKSQETYNISLKKFYEIKNKICILRTCGGLGDIINMRMIFQDIKSLYPEFHITWALPSNYFAAAERHPYVDKVIHCGDLDRSEYLQIYNLTNACTRYEWAKGKDNDKNRADIWAEHIGIKLHNHNAHMPSYNFEFENIKCKLKMVGWDGSKKLISFAPRSALAVKNLTQQQVEFIKNLTKDFFLVIVHSYPILEFVHLGIPMLTGMPLKEAIATIQLCDMNISTDTGIMHIAGAYGKPSMAIFSYTNGYNIAKYYENVNVVQKHIIDNTSTCGPCNNYYNCTESDNPESKPCMTTIGPDMLSKGWNKLLENYTKYINN